MDMLALIICLHTIHTILKITYDISDENTSFSFCITIKGHNKDLKHNSVTFSLNRL